MIRIAATPPAVPGPLDRNYEVMEAMEATSRLSGKHDNPWISRVGSRLQLVASP
jgi:hypothetical protein